MRGFKGFICGSFFVAAASIFFYGGCAWAESVISFWEMLAVWAGGGLCALIGWLCSYERG